ncbi:MAG: undecaprenyl-diphosphate phosphatase [Nitrososphaerota archaeon]|jgi:undecaprenyl-diphosphatase|nr:undecaprenyl-diphosphate phosphatase [Nitrososphaerota archaeon]MDG6937195.1 undecaprenyl-diphosphate phosphatase [Nitrososphaerota archaeon]MDG6961791.1 undecaprenyl-diphosphate phosphatase [Nitrososphaerota archaeon]MDG6970307.1 undecaprenyl-diphosphate phosphatase [Nitrososphaerota archaeon]MDG6972437.1 undecaprenyl-diphosphate phosphatase [Nitrososphaerota archaeon]
MSSWLLGIVLGIVQGVSEWLPVSSKTQVIIASTYLFGLNFNEAYALGLFLEAGTFIAAAYYFRHEVWKVLLALVGKGDEEGRMLLKFLLVVTVFTGLVGVALYATVQSVSGPALGLPMIILGCILIGDGLLITYAKGRYVPTKGLRDLSLKELVLLGVVQGVSALPGVSRSGITVSAMLLLGINPKDAFKLSFLALIPASIGAAGVTVLFSGVSVTGAIVSITPQVIVLAVLVSVVIGVAFIGLLLRVAGSRRIALLTFALGALALASGIVSILTGVSG